MSTDLQSYGIAAGLVVVTLFGLVVVWKVTKSLFKLVFWIVAALLILVAGWWLLVQQGILPPASI